MRNTKGSVSTMSDLATAAVAHEPHRRDTPERAESLHSAHGLAARLGRLQPSRFSGIYLWMGFVVIFAIWVPDTFLTAATAKSIVGDQAITAILALAVLFPLAVGEFDLSIAQNLGFSAFITGALMNWSGVSPALAIVIALSAGLAIGAVNGFLVAVVGVSSFIATLGMTSVLLAATDGIAKGQYVGPFPSSFEGITSHTVVGVPGVTVYALVLALVAWYVLEHTPVGRRTFATGAGREAARLAGVRTRQYVFWSFVVCGGGASLAGVLLASKIGSVSQDVGPAYLLPAFAACFLGATQLKLGRFNVWGTILALVLLATGVKGLQLAGGQLWITELFNGLALIGAVSVAVLSERRQVKRQRQQRAAASEKEEQS
jgi:ribose transport system permease protein